MREVYTFFGFGNTFINMMETLGNNRSACIILDKAGYSKSFPLGKGRPQGDPPSPLQYNLAEQILLFKLELDPAIQGIARPPPPLPLGRVGQLPILNIFGRHESNRETSNSDAFADDTSLSLLVNINSLTRVKTILEDFGAFSGLKCNIDKSFIMRVGDRENLPQEILDLGFTETDNIKILGLDIDFNLDCLSSCHNNTVQKIRNIANFWSRFRLSLPSRINILKTLMLSQISYLGSIITPTAEQFAEMCQITEGFVKGNINISKDRLYLPDKMGGLGLIDLKDFVTAQQVTWVKKSQNSTCDNWRCDLKNLSYSNCYVFTEDLVNQALHPILFNIGESNKKFLNQFYNNNENSRDMFIFNNPILTRDRNNDRLLDEPFFRQIPCIMNMAPLFKYSDFFHEGQPMLLDSINTRLTTSINLNTYLRLTTALGNFTRAKKINAKSDGTTVNIGTFLNKFRKGSRQIREVLAKKQLNKVTLKHQKTVKTFFRLIGIPIFEDSLLMKVLPIWNRIYLPNRMREFLFKFFNNCLGINTRLSHFIENPDRRCTFCKLQNPNTMNEETFQHLFFHCRTTVNWHQQFMRKFLPELVDIFNDRAESKVTFWASGIFEDRNGEKKFNAFISVAVLQFQYLIWEAKLKKKNPSFHTLIREFFPALGKIFEISGEIKMAKNNENFLLCREWENLLLQHGG